MRPKAFRFQFPISVITHYSLLITHFLIAHCSLLIAHYSLLITHCSLLNIHVAHCFHTVLVAIAGGIAAARRAGTNTAS